MQLKSTAGIRNDENAIVCNWRAFGTDLDRRLTISRINFEKALAGSAIHGNEPAWLLWVFRLASAQEK